MSKNKWSFKVRKFKENILDEYDLSAYELNLLDAICENFQIFYDALKEIDKHGLNIVTKNGIRKNPATESKDKAWAAVLAGLRAINIKYDDDKPDYVGKPGVKKGSKKK